MKIQTQLSLCSPLKAHEVEEWQTKVYPCEGEERLKLMSKYVSQTSALTIYGDVL